MALNIKAAMELRGRTSAWLAKKMGVTEATVSGMINGNPTYETMVRIASVLHCDVAELFDRPKIWSKT